MIGYQISGVRYQGFLSQKDLAQKCGEGRANHRIEEIQGAVGNLPALRSIPATDKTLDPRSEEGRQGDHGRHGTYF